MNEIKNLILEIMELAFEISNKSKADIFVYYSPHVPQLDIHYHDEGWTEITKNYDKKDIIYLSNFRKNEKWIEKDIANLKDTRARLTKLAEELPVFYR